MRTALVWYKSDGVIQTPASTGFTTLAAGTYYADLGAIDSSIVSSVHYGWDAALVAAITLEQTNFPDASIFGAAATSYWGSHAATTISPNASASQARTELSGTSAPSMMRARAK